MKKAILDLEKKEIKKECKKHKCCSYDCPLCVGETEDEYICFKHLSKAKIVKIIQGEEIEI